MHTRPLFAAALLPVALAYQSDHPILAWSSLSTNGLSVMSATMETEVMLRELLSSDTVCAHDAVVLIDQIGLRVSDFRSLPKSSSIVRRFSDAPSSAEFPYMYGEEENPYYDLASAVAQRCGSRIIGASAEDVLSHLEGTEAASKKHVVCVSLPPLEGVAGYRKHQMMRHEQQLSSALEAVASTFPKHLVVYTGWTSTQSRRQQFEGDDDDADMDMDLLDFVESPVPTSTTIPVVQKAAASDGGILKRYQLLTPGLIVSLFVVLFILIPVLYMAVSALASIQSSVRLDAPKGFNAVEKKNQ